MECIFADISGYPRGKLMPAQRFAAGDVDIAGEDDAGADPGPVVDLFPEQEIAECRHDDDLQEADRRQQGGVCQGQRACPAHVRGGSQQAR